MTLRRNTRTIVSRLTYDLVSARVRNVEVPEVETRIPDINIAHDYGHEVYDTTISARDIQRMWKHGLLGIDPEAQRGIDTVKRKPILKQEKIDRWTEDLLQDRAVFGQLTWNFRPDDTNVHYDPETRSLVIEEGSATIPDSGHRHQAIVKAVDSIANGSSFDVNRRFSLRIWRVPADTEKEIFYWMNQEGDKADATRSKWLAQRSNGQRIAREVVRSCAYMTERNIETVTNTLSVKNHRLAAFNTIAGGFEDAFADVTDDDVESTVTWFIGFWEQLVTVLPELQRVPLPERQRIRKESLVGSAVTIHGYIRLARFFRDGDHDLALLGRLAEPSLGADGTLYPFFSWGNPIWQEVGILAPSVNTSGEQRLNIRNSHQSRRAMAAVLAAHVGVPTDVLPDGAVLLPASATPALAAV